MAVSTPWEYEGYSEEIYDGFELKSQYLTMRDGVKLAIDIYRPTKNGILHNEKLPVIWTCTQYKRSARNKDGSRTMLSDNSFFAGLGEDGLPRILRHGYIIAVLDARGTGASFGSRSQQTTWDDSNDLHDVNEWLASQDYCNGKTGMFGTSFLGRVQYMTALTGAPSLKCIVPMVCALEYPTMTMNGIWNIGWMKHLNAGNKKNGEVDLAPAVDEDPDEKMLMQAVEDHKNGPDALEERRKAKYFDSLIPGLNRRVYMETYFPYFLNNINNSKVAVYIWGGTYDFQPFGSFQWYRNLTVPKKMTIWSAVHTGQFLPGNPDWTVEHLRWYDYWLKGIDNGIMDEPPIMIQNDRAPVDNKTQLWDKGIDKDLNGSFPCPYLDCEKEYRYYDEFPPKEMEYKDFYFDGEKSGTVASVNDGSLTTRKPLDECGKDSYTVDYSVTRSGYFDRNMFHEKNVKLDYTEIDEKSLTYTTAPLAKDLDVIGFPVAHLWVTSSAKDVDFYVTVEEVDKDGFSWLLSDGKIRASFRGTMTPPFDNMELPWHRFMEHDQKDMPIGEAVQIDLALAPMSHTLAAGNRLRIQINNADRENWDTPELSEPPVIEMLRNKEHASYISMPVIEK